MATNWGDLWQAVSRREVMQKTGWLGGIALLLAALLDRAGAQPAPPAPGTATQPGLVPLPRATALPVGGGADYFLFIDGIVGDSQDFKHKGHIDVLSFSWGASQAGTTAGGGGGGAGKVQLQDFHFVIKNGLAGPRLFVGCATGERFKGAILTARQKAGKEDYLKYTMTDVMVSSYQTNATQQDPGPVDQFSLNYARLDVEYRPQMPDGSLGPPMKGGYDLKMMKKV